jgi:hypothetical protein
MDGNRVFSAYNETQSELTFWSSTARFEETSNAVPLQPQSSDVLAETYLFYYPPCGEPSDNISDPRNPLTPLAWGAYKATWSLCLQTIEVSFVNSSLLANVTKEERDLDWKDGRKPTNESISEEKCYTPHNDTD